VKESSEGEKRGNDEKKKVRGEKCSTNYKMKSTESKSEVISAGGRGARGSGLRGLVYQNACFVFRVEGKYPVVQGRSHPPFENRRVD